MRSTPAPLGSDGRTQPPGSCPRTPACANPHLFKRSLEVTGARHFQPALLALQCPGLSPILCCTPSLRAVGGARESMHVTVFPIMSQLPSLQRGQALLLEPTSPGKL